MDELLEARQGTKVQDVLDRALAMERRSPRSYPESELDLWSRRLESLRRPGFRSA